MSLQGGREIRSGAASVLGRPERLVTFREVLNPRTDFDQLERLLSGQLNESESASLKDFKLYILKGEDAWVLDQVGTGIMYLYHCTVLHYPLLIRGLVLID